jgi:hypothetical protein
MDQNELGLRVEQMHQKMDYAFATLTFGTLALSFQFSPSMGTKWPWLLIASWLALIISGLVGGWRITLMPSYYRLNLAANELERYIQGRKTRLGDHSFQTKLRTGKVTDGETGQSFTEDGWKAGIKVGEGKLVLARDNMRKIQSKIPWSFRIQAATFGVGIFLNGAFCSVNFLEKSRIIALT